jgi:hypothetical protein
LVDGAIGCECGAATSGKTWFVTGDLSKLLW